MSAKKESNGLNSLPVLLFITFLVLKLGEWTVVADWSWWWVTAPLWIPVALFILLGTVGLILVLVFGKELGHSDEKEDV